MTTQYDLLNEKPSICGKCFRFTDVYGWRVIIFEVPKHLGCSGDDFIEMWSQPEDAGRRYIGEKDITRLVIGDTFKLAFQPRRVYPVTYNDCLTHNEDYVLNTGRYFGEGVFDYYNTNINFTFTTNILQGQYNLKLYNDIITLNRLG